MGLITTSGAGADAICPAVVLDPRGTIGVAGSEIRIRLAGRESGCRSAVASAAGGSEGLRLCEGRTMGVGLGEAVADGARFCGEGTGVGIDLAEESWGRGLGLTASVLASFEVSEGRVDAVGDLRCGSGIRTFLEDSGEARASVDGDWEGSRVSGSVDGAADDSLEVC